MQRINKLAAELGKEAIDPLRFRENFYIQWDNEEAFYEEKFLGKSIQIGNDVILHILQANVRCSIICVDPKTAEKDVTILTLVSKLHDVKFGIYAAIRKCGPVTIDDTIYLLE